MKKNILVVDDSALLRRVICDIINSDSKFQANDICRDGLEAYETLKSKSKFYDCVVLDIQMPRMDGLQLLERLRKERIYVRIIIVSTITTKDADVTMLAMERGALDFVTKPTNVVEAKGDVFKKRLLDVLHAVTNTPYDSSRPDIPEVTIPKRKVAPPNSHHKLVALACSTGGPKSLQSVIPCLPKNLDAPVVIVQHMPAGFTKPMADRLAMLSKIRVKEAEDGETLKKGVVYIAPGGFHLMISKNPDGSHRAVLDDTIPAIGGLKPCANITYDSLSKSGYDEIVCVVLTGMGSDGTKGILSLERHKPIHVIAQNAETCVVYGMPKAIVEAGMVDEVVPLDEIAKTITKNIGVK
jgi:two-component system chemotaxis response regulator CheB